MLSPAGKPLDTPTAAYARDPAGACALLSAGTGVATAGSSAAAPQYDAPLPPVTVDGLLTSTGYLTKVFACNAEGASRASCLAPANEPAPSGCNGSSAVPPTTQGPPEAPPPVTQNEGAQYRDIRVHTLLLSWSLPYDNEVPLTLLILAVGNNTYALPPDTTTYNVTGLPAATQFAVRLRGENALGLGPFSSTNWVTTLPSPPERPPHPRCDPKKMNHTSLFINLDEPTTNGQPIESYELRVFEGAPPLANDSLAMALLARGFSVQPLIYEARVGHTPEERMFPLTNRTVAALSRGLYNISESTEYTVIVRAYNVLGWSAWSLPSCRGSSGCPDPCTTPADPGPPFPWMILIIAVGAALALVLVCFYVYYRSNASKIFAPQLRKRREGADPLNDFVSSDQTPMEEQDPELVINPIFIHKIEMERERQRKEKRAKGGLGRSGGLARLGLRFEDRAQVVDERAKDLNAVDHFLTREGIGDDSKSKTAYEKHLAGKALAKAGKKAQERSHLETADAKAREKAAAREAAREAARMGGGHGDDDGGNEMQGGRRGGGAGSSENTAIL